MKKITKNYKMQRVVVLVVLSLFAFFQQVKPVKAASHTILQSNNCSLTWSYSVESAPSGESSTIFLVDAVLEFRENCSGTTRLGYTSLMTPEVLVYGAMIDSINQNSINLRFVDTKEIRIRVIFTLNDLRTTLGYTAAFTQSNNWTNNGSSYWTFGSIQDTSNWSTDLSDIQSTLNNVDTNIQDIETYQQQIYDFLQLFDKDFLMFQDLENTKNNYFTKYINLPEDVTTNLLGESNSSNNFEITVNNTITNKYIYITHPTWTTGYYYQLRVSSNSATYHLYYYVNNIIRHVRIVWNGSTFKTYIDTFDNTTRTWSPVSNYGLRFYYSDTDLINYNENKTLNYLSEIDSYLNSIKNTDITIKEFLNINNNLNYTNTQYLTDIPYGSWGSINTTGIATPTTTLTSPGSYIYLPDTGYIYFYFNIDGNSNRQIYCIPIHSRSTTFNHFVYLVNNGQYYRLRFYLSNTSNWYMSCLVYKYNPTSDSWYSVTTSRSVYIKISSTDYRRYYSRQTDSKLSTIVDLLNSINDKDFTNTIINNTTVNNETNTTINNLINQNIDNFKDETNLDQWNFNTMMQQNALNFNQAFDTLFNQLGMYQYFLIIPLILFVMLKLLGK